MNSKKQDMKNLKKTVEAYGTFSEEEALKKAKDIESAGEIIIEDENKEPVVKRELSEEESRAKRRGEQERRALEEAYSVWEPKTKLGREVREGKITSIDEVLDSGRKILEAEIVDKLVELKSDLLSIGQSKGKFGGGKRRAWRQTQRKTEEGNVPTFSTMAVVGDEKGHVGIGYGRAKETLPARDKAVRKAKLNIIKIARTCSGFDCSCDEKHTIPFKVEGKSGSVRLTLIPAPQGTGLVVANELKKVLKLAGIKDVYSRSKGSRRTTFNLVKACIDALKKTTSRKMENSR
jgi:small subunit ribosomal protein S5